MAEALNDRPLLKDLIKSPGGIPTATGKAIKYLSPTHISSYRDCPSRWYGERILGMRRPEAASTTLGSNVHAAAEALAKTGALPPDTDPAVARLVAVLEPAIPSKEEVDNGDTFLEVEFYFQPAGFPVPLYGVIDKLRTLRKSIEDYKTTSSFEYVKNEWQLKRDPQTIVYCGFLLSEDEDAKALQCWDVDKDGKRYVRFRHDYVRTRGAPQYTYEEVLVSEEDLSIGLETIRREIDDMAKYAALPFLDVPKNTDACSKYGGCHMKAFCLSKGVAVPGADPSIVAYMAKIASAPEAT